MATSDNVLDHAKDPDKKRIMKKALEVQPPQIPPTPSSSINGFFQSPPLIPNQFQDDIALTRALRLFTQSTVQHAIKSDLTRFGDLVLSPKILTWVGDAERNLPYVKHFDTFGRRRDELVTSEGWRNLQALGIEEGMVGIGYQNDFKAYSRVYQFAKYALWCGSAAWVNCPSLMVDGVASLFRKYLIDPALDVKQRDVLQSAYDRLTSRDPSFAWTTGQWMTERQGGSDVSMTETLAEYSPDPNIQARATDGHALGPWNIDGFKWFSSATDANMMVLLARTPKGISLFYAPMRKTLLESPNRPTLQASATATKNATELNGVTIQRLKNKLGTKALPTAELELNGVRAWLVGEEGRGTKEIATVLNVARVHNGVTGIGLWGRGLAIVRAWTKVRVVGRRPLWERVAFMRNLAAMHVEYRANVLFNLFVAALLGVAEQEEIESLQTQRKRNSEQNRSNTNHQSQPESPSRQHQQDEHGLSDQASHTTQNIPDLSHGDTLGQIPGLRSIQTTHNLLRLLTPALKGHCSKTAIAGLQECMECLGGIGYLENDDMTYNIARLYRDANVMPIWEGTTDMMADDAVLRVLFGKNRNAAASFEEWIESVLEIVDGRKGFRSECAVLKGWWSELRKIMGRASREEAETKCRALMGRIVDIVQGSLLVVDALSDGDEIAGMVVRTWFVGKEKDSELKQVDWREQQLIDLQLVFGVTAPQIDKARL